jgi:hypothetical protein
MTRADHTPQTRRRRRPTEETTVPVLTRTRRLQPRPSASTPCATCDHHHPRPTTADLPETRLLEGPPGCRGCDACQVQLRLALVPDPLRAAHLLVLSCLEDLVWEEGHPHVGLVALARRFAVHAWPPRVPVDPRHATWADPSWLVEDCSSWGLVDTHAGLPAGRGARAGSRPEPVTVALTPAGALVLEAVTWRPLVHHLG